MTPATPPPLTDEQFHNIADRIRIEVEAIDNLVSTPRTTKADLIAELTEAAIVLGKVLERWSRDRAVCTKALADANFALDIAKKERESKADADLIKMSALRAQITILQDTLLEAVRSPNLALGRMISRTGVNMQPKE